MTEKCNKCKFFEILPGATMIGHCLRYPPTLLSNMSIPQKVTVSFTDWCGEFESAGLDVVIYQCGTCKHSEHLPEKEPCRSCAQNSFNYSEKEVLTSKWEPKEKACKDCNFNLSGACRLYKECRCKEKWEPKDGKESKCTTCKHWDFGCNNEAYCGRFFSNWEPKEKDTESRCPTCKFSDVDEHDEPCCDCYFGAKDKTDSKWEAKNSMSSPETIARLMKFYNVHSIEELVMAQVEHIESIQKQLPSTKIYDRPVRA